VSAASPAFKMTWLWSVFAGFYLVAYCFWLPSLFSSPVVVILAAALTLVLGLSLVYDGFSAAVALQGGPATKPLSLMRLRRMAGGGLLLAYLLVYAPRKGGSSLTGRSTWR
jgi:Na+-driven multidrug efflux pump